MNNANENPFPLTNCPITKAIAIRFPNSINFSDNRERKARETFR